MESRHKKKKPKSRRNNSNFIIFYRSDFPPTEDKDYDFPTYDDDEQQEKIYEDLTGLLQRMQMVLNTDRNSH